MITILGAGLSGIAVADHLQKAGEPYEMYEAKAHGGGHIHSEKVDGFTWDEGPHVSFAKSEYVKQYFAGNCGGEYLEFATAPSNYYRGNWIPHPAQSHMYAVPEPLRSACIADLKEIRASLPADYKPADYGEWIDYAFGKTFSHHFPEAYTDKYWTTAPKNLATDWIGKRVYFPDVADMVESAQGPLNKQTHYLTRFRYPETGGFYAYIKTVEQRLDIQYNKRLKYISFAGKRLEFEDGTGTSYERLVSTLPLPMLIQNSDAPQEIKAQAAKLKCSQVLIVNVVAKHTAPLPNHWIYIYDRELYATRINFTELLSPNNGVAGKTGIQVEVYFSDYRPLALPVEAVAQAVVSELITMKLVEGEAAVESHHWKWIDWANVIFDNERMQAQAEVLNWLEGKGLTRESDDLDAMTDWDAKQQEQVTIGEIALAGRFAQWKYYWTDDCVLRGKLIADNIVNVKA